MGRCACSTRDDVVVLQASGGVAWRVDDVINSCSLSARLIPAPAGEGWTARLAPTAAAVREAFQLRCPEQWA
jgi:hypothetical protein